MYEGVGWHTQGSHTYGYNDIGLGVAFIGNFVGKGLTWGRGTLGDEVLCEISGKRGAGGGEWGRGTVVPDFVSGALGAGGSSRGVPLR